MSSAKAQLESDMRVLAFEVGRQYGLRINTISAGTLTRRAARSKFMTRGQAGPRGWMRIVRLSWEIDGWVSQARLECE